MAIISHIRTKKTLSQNDVIAMAKGTIDEYGNPFDAITVVHIKKSSGKGPYKTHGFEDVFFDVDDGNISIKYRGLKPYENGTLDFIRNDLGVLEAICPKTPHNMKMLAAHFDNGDWKIKDPEQRMVIQKMWEDMQSGKTEEQIRVDEDFKKGRNRPHNDDEPYKVDVKELERQKNEEIAFLQKKLDEANQKLKNEAKQPVQQAVSPALEYNQFKKKAEMLGIPVSKTTKLGDLKRLVKEAEDKLKTEEKQHDNQPVVNQPAS